MKYKVITLCGSTKYKNEFMRVTKEFTLKGNLVLNLNVFAHGGDHEACNPGMRKMLKEMQIQKIDMSDEIFVINPEVILGESTKEQIEYAKIMGKKVSYLYDECIINTINKWPEWKQDMFINNYTKRNRWADE